MKSNTIKVTTLILAIVLPLFMFAQNKATEIDKLMQTYNDYGRFNGMVLVAENGKVIFNKGYGLANMEWEVPNKPDTKFRLASITKQFTSMLIMQLVEEGKIKLDAKITDYLPEYRKDTGDKVTIHHLLTHTSGIPSYTNSPDWRGQGQIKHTVDEMVKEYCSGDFEFEPGTKYSYNNSGYFLLGAIIEKVAGKSYETVLKEKIFDPIGMENSGYDHFESIIENRADGYQKNLNGYIHAPYFDTSNPYAAGSLYSTADDLYLWDQALYSNKLLSKKYKKIMFTPYKNNYAYGWSVYRSQLGESTDSINVITHSGGINGFSTRIYRMIDDKHLIVLLNNIGTSLSGMATGIQNILYNRPNDLPKKSIAATIVKTLADKDIASVVKYYNDLKANQKDEYIFLEGELNNLGYQLIGMNRIKDAIEIFKLNVEEYPEAFNPYDSLGEAYMTDGQNELAIKNYAKSLEINPNNIGAITMLGKIIQAK
jgi:CubicO group peptidase (beta-lactamase class C family)